MIDSVNVTDEALLKAERYLKDYSMFVSSITEKSCGDIDELVYRIDNKYHPIIFSLSERIKAFCDEVETYESENHITLVARDAVLEEYQLCGYKGR